MIAPRRRLVRTLAIAALVLAGACSDGDDAEDEGASPSSTDPTTSTTTAAVGSEDPSECDAAGARMDPGALGLEPAAPEEAVEAFAEQVLGWDDAVVSAGSGPCSFDVASPSHERTVAVRVALGESGTATIASASSYGPADDVGLGVSLRGTEASIASGAHCEGCVGATVHLVYAGGVETLQVELPVEAVTFELPPGATRRGVVILLHDRTGGVQAVQATSFPEGDFAAG